MSRARRPAVRGVLLHARARGLGTTLDGYALVAVGVVLGGTDRGWAALPVAGRPAPVVLVLFTAVLVAVLGSRGLGGADEELERSLPVRWTAWRAAHLLLLVAACAALLAPAAVRLPEPDLSGVLVATSVGMLGLACLGVVVLGTSRGWTVPLGYALVVHVVAPPSGAELPAWSPWWAWPALADPAAPGLVPALVVAATGAAVFVARGSAWEDAG